MLENREWQKLVRGLFQALHDNHNRQTEIILAAIKQSQEEILMATQPNLTKALNELDALNGKVTTLENSSTQLVTLVGQLLTAQQNGDISDDALSQLTAKITGEEPSVDAAIAAITAVLPAQPAPPAPTE